MIGSDIFNALYASLPDARCTVKAGEYTALQCLCPSIGQTAGSSEQGLYASADISVRMLESDDDPAGGFQFGKRVALTMATGGAHEFRVSGRVVAAGVLRLMLEGITD